MQLCNTHPLKHLSTSRTQGHFLTWKDKNYLCRFLSTDLNYKVHRHPPTPPPGHKGHFSAMKLSLFTLKPSSSNSTSPKGLASTWTFTQDGYFGEPHYRRPSSTKHNRSGHRGGLSPRQPSQSPGLEPPEGGGGRGGVRPPAPPPRPPAGPRPHPGRAAALASGR